MSWECMQLCIDFDYSCSNQPHILAPSRLLILTMSMMDSDLKKQAEKAASICLAAPFLKVLQAICVDGADDGNTDNGAADDDADNNSNNDADINADDDATTQMMDGNLDNNAACRQQSCNPDNGLRRRQWAKTQTTTNQP
jgi:hypothetical protein